MYILVKAGGKEAWISDGLCDDINNNLLCQHDGGDCCGVNVRKQYCINCECTSKLSFYYNLHLCMSIVLQKSHIFL